MSSIKKCFECDKIATEEHHVIPRVMGGTKTIPLCTKCHMKVHNLDGTRRADNHSENIKRGIDKSRAWELFAVYRITFHDNVKDINSIKELLLKDFNHDISVNRVQRLYDRLLENDIGYLKFLFDKYIDSDLSSEWDEKDAQYQLQLYVTEISEILRKHSTVKGFNYEDIINKSMNKINKDFQNYKSNKVDN